MCSCSLFSQIAGCQIHCSELSFLHLEIYDYIAFYFMVVPYFIQLVFSYWWVIRLLEVFSYLSNALCRRYNTHVQEYPQGKILKGELLSPGVYTLLILLYVAKLPSCRLYSCAVPSAICEFICFPTCSSTQSVVKLTFQVLSILWIKSDIIWQLSFVFLLLPLT